MTTPLRDTKVIALATPGTVPIDSANLGFAIIQVNMSGRSRRRIGATTRADVLRTVWRHRGSVYLRNVDFCVFVSVPIEFAPGVLSEDDIRIGHEMYCYIPAFFSIGDGIANTQRGRRHAVDDLYRDPLCVTHLDFKSW